MSDSLHPVPVGACRCPGTPHEGGDVVSLYPELPLDGGLAAQAAMWLDDQIQRGIQLYGAMLDHGIAEWTFVDENGEPEPIDHDTIRRLLPWAKGGADVSHAAAALYGAAVTTPFAQIVAQAKAKLTQTSSSSPTGPTARSSTSPKRATTSKRRKR